MLIFSKKLHTTYQNGGETGKKSSFSPPKREGLAHLTRERCNLSAKCARYRINGRKRAFFGVFFYISPEIVP
ncbi:hypothetical protein [Fibrobacter sp.]